MNSLPEGKARPAHDVIFRELGDEMVLLNLKSGVYFGLNQTGTQMWKLLVKLQEPARVLTVLEQEYAASRAQLESDLSGLLCALHEKGLLELNED